MKQASLFALVVSDGSECFEKLRSLLKRQDIEVRGSQTFEEAARLLDQTHPELIFTATRLVDGTWSDIVNMAGKLSVATNVIVVGSHGDVRVDLATIDYGAFDFILPPFQPDPIAHVIRVDTSAERPSRNLLPHRNLFSLIDGEDTSCGRRSPSARNSNHDCCGLKSRSGVFDKRLSWSVAGLNPVATLSRNFLARKSVVGDEWFR